MNAVDAERGGQTSLARPKFQAKFVFPIHLTNSVGNHIDWLMSNMLKVLTIRTYSFE